MESGVTTQALFALNVTTVFLWEIVIVTTAMLIARGWCITRTKLSQGERIATAIVLVFYLVTFLLNRITGDYTDVIVRTN